MHVQTQGDETGSAARDATADVTGTSPRAAMHKERGASAASKFAACRHSDDPFASVSQAASRNNTSAGSNVVCRPRSPPMHGPYMLTTPDGVTVPLPQPSSQRSDRPVPSDVGDLREYSSANAIPISTFVRAQRWRLYGSSPTSCHANAGSPRPGSVPSRRGGLLGPLSQSNTSRCGSVDSRSTHSAAYVALPPPFPSDVIMHDIRTPADSGPAVRAPRAQADAAMKLPGKGVLKDAAGGRLYGRADSVHGAKVFGFGVGVPQHGAQHGAQHGVQHGAQQGRQGQAAEPCYGRTRDVGGSMHGVRRAEASGSGGHGGRRESRGEGGEGDGASRRVWDQSRLSDAIRMSSVHVPPSTQHGAHFGPHLVSLAGGCAPVATVLQPPPGSAGGPDTDLLRAGPAALHMNLSTQHTVMDRGVVAGHAPSRSENHHHAVHQVPTLQAATGHDVQHSTQHSTQHSAPPAAYHVLPGDGGSVPQVGRQGSCTSSSSLNTSPRAETLTFRQHSATESTQHSTHHSSQRELPRESPFGSNSALPGATVALMMADKRLASVRQSKSFSHRERQTGATDGRPDRHSASQISRKGFDRKPGCP